MPERRKSGRERRFSEIADILKLQQAVEGPQLERQQIQQRQEMGDLNAILGVLGLAQQAAEVKSRETEGALNRGVQERELSQQKELGQGQLDASRMRTKVDALGMVPSPQMPNAPLMNALSLMVPELAQGQQQAQQADLAGRVGRMTPQVQAIYGSMGNRPSEMQKVLPTLQASDPEAFARLPWEQLNSTLGLTPTAVDTPSVLTPKSPFEQSVVNSPILQNIWSALGLTKDKKSAFQPK